MFETSRKTWPFVLTLSVSTCFTQPVSSAGPEDAGGAFKPHYKLAVDPYAKYDTPPPGMDASGLQSVQNTASTQAAKPAPSAKSAPAEAHDPDGEPKSQARDEPKYGYSQEIIQHLKIGAQYLRDKKYDDAKAEFESAIKQEPSCAEAYNNLGLIYLRQDDLNNARDQFRKALNLKPLFLPSLTNLGLVMYKRGELDESILLYRQALQLTNGKDAELLVNLANVLRDKGDSEEAIKYYQRAVTIKPQYAPAFNGIAAAYYNRKDYEKADQMALKAISLKPDYALAYFHLGLIELARGHRKAAIDAYESSLKYETNPAYAKDTRDKLTALKATGIAGSDLMALNALLKAGSWQEAEKEIERLKREGHTGDPVMWNDLGIASSHLGDYNKAIFCYKKAISLSKNGSPTSQYNLGQAYRLTGDLDHAEYAFRQSIEDAHVVAKTDPYSQNMLGVVLKQKGDLQGADAAYRRAISQAGDDLPVAHFNLGVLLEKTDRKQEAAREYKTYLSLEPTGVNAEQARRRLKRLSGT